MVWLYRKLSFLLLFVSLTNQSFSQPTSQESEPYKSFITSLGNNIINILVNKNAPLIQRKEKFRHVLRDYFDVPEIGNLYLQDIGKEQQTNKKRNI